MSLSTMVTFGVLLRQLRRRAAMTQSDLAAAVGYSVSFISSLERNSRQPDVQTVMQRFIPALGLREEPHFAARLLELAVTTRGDLPPAGLTLTRETHIVVTDPLIEPPVHLPAPPTALLGRQEEVKTLCNRLLGHSGRLLTLVGPPGIGKTRLGLAVGAALQSVYKDGACFVPLAAVSDPALVASTLVTTLQLQDGSSKPAQTRVIEHLRRKELLLVLDNFEQLLSPPLSGEGQAVRLVAELLAECAGLRVLVTSRERLHLRAEQRFKVPPLDLAPAVELFVQCAQTVDAAFSRTPHNQATLEAICQRLDCLPLALELCAAQIELLSPAQLLAHLHDRRLDLLVAGAHDLPPRQRTLRTAIQHSYRLLNEEERTLFRSLGVFVGGFDLGAMARVAKGRRESGDGRLNADAIPPSLVATLSSLVSKSLVHSEPLPSGERRFLLLETLREFALEQLHAQDEEAELRQRHYAAYLQFVRTTDSHLRRPEEATWVARLAPDLGNIRAALQWALDEAHYTDAAWLMVAVSYFWGLSGHWDEDAMWLARLLPHRQALAVDLRLAILLRFHRSASVLEEYQPLERWTREITQLREGCADQLLQATAWTYLAGTMSDVAQAVTTLERGVALARAASEAPGLGAEFGALADRDFVLESHLFGYAAFLVEQGEVTQARPIITEGLALARVRSDPTGIAECLATLGIMALLQGDLAQALTLFHEVMAIATSCGSPVMPCAWQPFLGIVTLYSGDAAEARRLLSESLRCCLALKNTFHLARVYTYLAEVALWEGELDQAAHWLAQGLSYQADLRLITIYQVECFWVAARLATAQEQYGRAATLFGLADQVHSQVHYAVAGPIRTLADAALATVRAVLEPRIFAETFATGQQLSLAEAFATILAPADGVGTMRAA